MDDESQANPAPQPPAGAPHRRAFWPLAAVAMVAVVGGGAGAYFGLRGAAGPGSAPGASPPARAFAAAAYDEESHQVVVFGGIGAEGTALDDTWTWDGSTWTQQHPKTSPEARAYAAMTYDPAAHDLVLVGGRSVSSTPPTVCSGSITAGGPNATPGTARAPAACPNQPAAFSDTWVWDGSTWRPAGSTPTALFGQTPALGTDAASGQVLMLGEVPGVGMNPACPSPAPSFAPGLPIPQVAIPCTMPAPASVAAWVWRGSSWTTVTSGALPPASGGAVGGFGAVATDPVSGHLVDVRAGIGYACGGGAPTAIAVPCPLVEGASGASSSSGGAGAARPADPLIPPQSASSPAGVPTIASPIPVPTNIASPVPTGIPVPAPVLCCSGSLTTWTGSAWSSPKTFTAGPQVSLSGIVGDPAQHELVAVTSQGTWTWNGSAWKAEHPPSSPPPAEGGSLVYDGAPGKVLLFGGEPAATFKPASSGSQSPAIPVSDELWAWDGSTWTQLTGAKPSPAPSLSPIPQPTFVPPGTPVPVSPAPTHIGPAPVPCTPAPTPTSTPTPARVPAPTPAQGAGSGSSCVPVLVPSASG